MHHTQRLILPSYLLEQETKAVKTYQTVFRSESVPSRVLQWTCGKICQLGLKLAAMVVFNQHWL